jgi:hypothetical protein
MSNVPEALDDDDFHQLWQLMRACDGRLHLC